MILLLLSMTGCLTSKPVEGPPSPLPAEPELPTLPPPDPSKGCIGDGVDLLRTPAWQAVVRYQDAVFARALARRGWSALPPPASVVRYAQPIDGFSLGMNNPDSGEHRLTEAGRNRLRDERGNYWVRTRLRNQCSEQPRFYIDRKLGVFAIHFAPRCRETRVVKVCGTLAAAGCGIEPPPQSPDNISDWLFVRAPEGAHWVGEHDAVITDELDVCFRLEPEQTSYPP